MQKCTSCGTDLSENSRFCGKCGSVQGALTTHAAATGSTTRQPPSWTPESGTVLTTWSPYTNVPEQGSVPAWSPDVPAPTTPPPSAENEDERRRGILPWSPFYGASLAGDALLGSGQVSPSGAPVVQGTPQIGSAPGVVGTSTPYTNAPVSPPAQGPANAAPGSPPAQGPGNAPSSQAGQQPTHNPPGQPGTLQHHPPHGPHRHPVHPEQHKPHQHHDHPEQHEPHRHHTHPAQHKPHAVARETKATGGSTVKTIMLVVTTVLVVAAGGIAAAVHFLSRPQPLISISSKYTVSNAPAGTIGTILHISGQQFASTATITFLLDGHVAPGDAGTRSDSNGTFRADMTITTAWSVGTHTLTARDANNDITKNRVSVTIVQPGQANTPGPNGAPPDDATFTLNIPANGRTTTVNEPFPNNDEALHISGHPDPAGGTVCLDRDNGQQFSASYVANNGTPFTETYTFSCQGSYKGGKISFTETLLTDVITFTDGSGISCTLRTPQLNQQVAGNYSGNGTVTGTWTYGPISQTAIPCTDPNQSFYYTSDQGTWTGTV